MDPCPRCGRENPPTTRACPGCGTPLAFGDEPAPGRLDLELDLDRRRRDPVAPAEPGPAPAPDASGPRFDPNRSDWRLAAPGEEPGEDSPQDEPGPDDEEALPGGGAASPARRLAAWAVDGGLVALAAVGVPAALVGFGGIHAPPGSTPCAFGSALAALLVSAEAFVAVVAYVYATVAHALAGATLGKRLARIRVVGPDGQPPGLATSAVRSAWALASVLLFGLGLLPAILGPSRRALHDLLAGTRVVDAP